jgi:glycosyltransferase involved in cell wall biosynthesis
MNILIVCPGYYPRDLGGGGIVAQAIAHGLAKRGNDVTIISGYHPEKTWGERPHKSCEGEVEIIWIPLMKLMTEKYPQLIGWLPPNFPSLAFLKTIHYERYDVIHLQGFGHLLTDYVNLIAENPRKILTIHAFPKYLEREGTGSLPLKLLYRAYCWTLGKHTLSSAKAITAVSKFTAEECVEKGIPKDKITVIENGIDLEKYTHVNCDELEQKFHLQKEDVLILSISRVTWYKGYEHAIKAIYEVVKATNKPIKYMNVGLIEDQNYYLRLRKQVEKLGLKNSVKFTGFLSHDMKLQALSRADIFLAPSLHEGFGLVILEAMALGKNIIASNCEGFRCILDNMRTGLIVEPGKSVEIANAILTLLENPGLGRKLSNNAYNEVRKYDWKTIIGKYEELY